MSLMLRLQALKQRHKSGHGHKLGQAKAKIYVDAPLVLEAPTKLPSNLDEVCSARRAISNSSIADVLPAIDYNQDSFCEEIPEAAPSLVSSASYSSSLTYAEPVDDGLNAWGLPKVVAQDPFDDEEDVPVLDEFPSAVPDAEEETFYDCEETFESSLPSCSYVPHPSATQLLAQKTLTVCYTALLTRRRQAAKPAQQAPQSWLHGWL